MRKQVLGLLLLVMMTCSIVIYSTNSVSGSQITISSIDAQHTDSSLLTQNSAETDQKEDSEENSQTDKQEKIATSGEEDSCAIKLVSDLNPQVECAKVYDIEGTVKASLSGDPEDISTLNGFNPFGWGRKPEALLNGIDNIIETGDDGKSKLLFNTLDFFIMGNDASLAFRKNTSIEEENLVNVGQEGQITLNLNKIIVSNAAIYSDASTDTARTQESPQQTISNLSDKENEKPWKSFLTSLWHGSRKRIGRLRTALLPTNLLVKPASAADFSADAILGSPTLHIRTPEAKIDSNGAVYAIQREISRGKGRTRVFSLTEQPIKVIDNSGKTAILSRNQTAVIDKTGLVEEPYEFKLCRFYKNNQDLLEGLAPKDIDFVRKQPRPLQFAYHTARSLTVPLYEKNCKRRCIPKGSA